MDETAFEKLRRIMPTFLAHQRGPRHRDGDLPEEVALKLTNRCNLRCKHCYQWNEDGHHRNLSKAEQVRDLDFTLVRELFEATRESKPNMYLWGGEPLIYDHWDELAALLAEDPRWTAICTNGLQIEERLPSLLRISHTLEMYVAVEGFAGQHDAIRGRGTFARTMRGIDALLEERRRGNYHGEISINTVITDAMVDHLCELIEFFENRGVDTIYLSFLWYLSPETSAKMDRYVGRHFNWLCTEAEVPRYSWYAYKYHQDPSMAARLMQELARVRSRDWKIKLRYNPYLEDEELDEFLRGSDKPAQGKTRCLAIHSRMDVMPNGDVVSCKFFPEFRMGNLKDGTAAAWQSERFQEMRATIESAGLMPVCSKCNLLYSRGA